MRLRKRVQGWIARPILLGPALVSAALLTAGPSLAGPLRLQRHFSQSAKAPSKALMLDGYEHLLPAHYEQLRKASTALLRRFHPERHVFVGVGRAPAAIVALLKNLAPELAETYPAGGLSGSAGDLALTPALQKLHGEHLDQLLGQRVLNSGRDIVLVDRALSGKTLRVMQTLVERHLQQMGSTVKVHAVGLSETALPGIEHLDISGWPELQQLHGRRYNAVAPYQFHAIGLPHGLADLKPNSGFDSYAKALVERMAHDKKLDNFLAASFPRMVETRPWDAPAAAIPSGSGQQPEQLHPSAAASAEFRKQEPRHPQPSVTPKAVPQKAPKAVAQKTNTKTAVTLDPRDTQARLQLNYGDERFDVLSASEYLGLREFASQLVNTYPPQQFHYVAVGRTGAPFVAMLETLHKGSSSYLPADGIAKGIKNEAAFDPFFSQLPQTVTSGQKRALLFRRAGSFESLGEVQRVLGNWLAGQGNMDPGVLVGISTRGDQGTGWIDISQFQGLVELLDERYKAVAPFPYFRIGSSKTRELTHRSEFDTYSQGISQIAASDPQTSALRAVFQGQ